MDKDTFARPGSRYGGTTLWMLNDRLEEEELRRQLRGFRDAGWSAVIDRTFNGLRTPYLSEEWHRLVRLTIAEAKELGLRVWLQAGYMPGGVPELSAQAQARALVRRAADEASLPEEEPIATRQGHVYSVRRIPHAVDLLSARACAEYIRISYTDCLERCYGDELGRTVETIWVDEPHFQPPLLPWSPELPARFAAAWGRELLDELESLFVETGDFLRTRHQYWRTVTSMLMEAYFSQIGLWCEQHGVAFGGHLMGEDTLQAQISWTGACMPCYEYMGIPGIDHLTASLRWPAERSFIITPKQCSSVANQLGKGRALAEMYGVSTQGLDFEDRKRIGEWILMLGINERCYHGSFYSLRGRRKRIYAPHLSHQQPWWPHNPIIADHFSRLSYLLRQGSYVADVLVLHPVESAWCRYQGTHEHNQHDRVRELGTVRAMTDSLVELSENLLKAHRGFDYGDESLLERYAGVEGKSLRVGTMLYRVVILPDLITIRATTLRLLARFVTAGGAILSVGALPSRVDGLASPEPAGLLGSALPIRNTSGELAEALDLVAPASARLEAVDGSDPGAIWMHERSVGDRRVFVLANTTGGQRVRARLVVPARGSFERWNVSNGEVSPEPGDCDEGTTTVPLDLERSESVVLAFAPRGPAGPRGRTASRVAPAPRSVPVSGPFSIVRADANVLPLDFCSYRTSATWSEILPVAAVQERLARESYRGPLSLRFGFRSDDVPSSLRLVVEDAAEHEIKLNGIPLGYSGLEPYLDRSFHPVEASAAVRRGENTIELTRRFEPPSESRYGLGALFHTSTGVEIEPIYLVGTFGVRCRVAEGPAGCLRLEPTLSLDAQPETTTGDLVRDGFPFFAGEITLRRNVDLEPAPGERSVLVLRDLHAAIAHVRANGSHAGHIAWPPYELDLTDYVVRGANDLTVTLVTSLRGLLGPHHRPSGEPTQVWADGWTGLSGPERRDTVRRSGPEWASRRASPEVFWTDDYMVPPLGIGPDCRIEHRPSGK